MKKGSPQSSQGRTSIVTIVIAVTSVLPFGFLAKFLVPWLSNGLWLISAGLIYGTSGLLLTALVKLIVDKTAKKPSLQSLVNFADLWGLQLRKKIKALAGDYDAEIAHLYKQRRYKTAHWNRILAWGYAIWYVMRGPLDWVTDYLISAVKGR